MNQANNLPAQAGRLILVGAEEACGADLLARMTSNGYDVISVAHGDSEALQQAASQPVAVLIVNTPVAKTSLRFNDVTDDDVSEALQRQLYNVVQAAQTVLPAMQPGARIVNIGSRGHLGAWGGVHLMAASAAMVAMTRCMSLELEADGITVNMIAAEFTGARTDTPKNRAAIVNAASFFASEGVGVSGETMVIDGHAALRMGEARAPRQAAA